MLSEIKMPKENNNKVYDLEERTAVFGEEIIDFAKTISKHVVTLPLINQLIRAGTAVGASYCEADCAETRKDFEHKLGICKGIQRNKTLAENGNKSRARFKK